MLQQLINENNYIQVEGLCETTIQLKVEGLNPAGSIKLKAAHALIADLVYCLKNKCSVKSSMLAR